MPAASPSQRDYWNGHAATVWTEHNARLDAMLEPVTEAALGALTAAKGASVLDIGCGAGVTTLALAKRGYKPVGVDISAPLLALARKRAEGLDIPFIEADAGAADVPGAPFGGLFSRFGVMFFEQPADAFANLRAQLKPDAPLAFVCWRGAAENAWNLIPPRAIGPMLPAPLPQPDPHAPGPMALADPERTRAIMTAAGWQGITIKPWDGRLPLGRDIADATDLLANIAHARLVAPFNLDQAEVRARIAELLRPMADTDGRVWGAAGCWIVTARA